MFLSSEEIAESIEITIIKGLHATGELLLDY